jgi:hypothetical protein
MAGFVTLESAPSTPQRFVELWSRLYTFGDAAYNDHIQMPAGGPLTSSDVGELMARKSGKRHEALARTWGATVALDTVNAPRGAPALDDPALRAHFAAIDTQLKASGLNSSGSIIWVIFLCHLGQPASVPIYDVNVWLAWGFITGWLRQKDLALVPKTLNSYCEYRSWFNELVARDGLEPRELDRALMSFGQFISSGWHALLDPIPI